MEKFRGGKRVPFDVFTAWTEQEVMEWDRSVGSETIAYPCHAIVVDDTGSILVNPYQEDLMIAAPPRTVEGESNTFEIDVIDHSGITKTIRRSSS